MRKEQYRYDCNPFRRNSGVISTIALRMMVATGLIWDLKPVPDRVREGKRGDAGMDAALKPV